MIEQLAYRYGRPQGTGQLRVESQDFWVQELIAIQPEGQGEHLWLNIKKQGMNTQFLAKRIAQWAKVPERQVAYAGLKDRHAITEQWFSVHLPGKQEPALSLLEDEEISVLSAARHSQKLRSAVLVANRFSIRLRNVSHPEEALQRWPLVCIGVPNYFGEQRFGIHGGNIEKARRMFAGQRVKRPLQSIYISAARSLLFNEMVSLRHQRQQHLQLIPGDVLKLAGSNSTFIQRGEPDLPERLASGDIQLTAPLWGKGSEMLQESYRDWVDEVVRNHPELCQGLDHVGAQLAFRALSLTPQSASLTKEGSDLVACFMLPPGSFATSVLRELIAYTDMAGEQHAHSD